MTSVGSPGGSSRDARPRPYSDRSNSPDRDPSVEGFEAFYRREYRAVVTLAHVLTGSPARAEDIAQDAFVAAFRSWTQLRQPDRWIRRVVTYKAKSWWRRRYSEQRAVSRIASATSSVVELPPETAFFWEQVRKLPLRQAQAVMLYYLDDLTASEIAAILGCAVGTARVHLSRGRRALAERLEVPE